ncbi:hypothetical protein E1264_26085 [Actinomadura sp. KC216]|uniref:hypothetical protein n=1 Tax=Actinomadura sp. KC216 TaxID=2530370 RepID=UPI001042ED91|nr:hypothetical protein [Actinomadura sp. KC216]TDB84055.1 hypothetical protein E1264_26085 [Actinomadura sp. KC216]
MSDGILLLFLREIFPEWSITRGADGVWRASGRVWVWASSVEGVLDALAMAEPDAGARVRSFFADA